MHYHIMYICGRLRKRFFMQVPETKSEYSKSRRYFTVDGITANSIAVLVTGTILSGYLKILGVSDSLNGIISALPFMLTIMQPIGAVLSERLKHRKLFVCSLAFIHRMLFSLMFFVPLLLENMFLRLASLIVLFSLAHGLSSLISPAANNWIISLTPRRVRGRYFSLREKYLIVIGSLVSLGAGRIIDWYTAAGNQVGAYTIISIIIAALAVINFLSLSHIMEPETYVMESGVKFRDIFLMPFKSKQFIPVVIFGMLWNISAQIAIPFLGVFWVGDLYLSYTYLMAVAMLLSIYRALILKKWGRLADRTSWAFATKIALIILAVSHILFFFIVPQNAVWMYIILSLVSNTSWAVLGISVLNLQFDYAPEKGRTLYIGANAAIGGLAGFGASFVGAAVIELMSHLNLTFLNAPLKGQQVLLVLSGILMLLCSLYIHLVLEKHKRNNR